MMTIKEHAERYADDLQTAAFLDSITIDESRSNNTAFWRNARLSKALLKIGNELEDWDEDDVEVLIGELTKKTGFNKPNRLRRLLTERSLESLLAVCSKIEDLFVVLKK